MKKSNKIKLQAVTDKICELLKGTELDPMVLKVGFVLDIEPSCYITDCWTSSGRMTYKINNSGNHLSEENLIDNYECIGSPIREAEVLMALLRHEIECRSAWCVYADGTFCNTALDIDCPVMWKVGKTLDEQSPKVWEFLDNILKC